MPAHANGERPIDPWTVSARRRGNDLGGVEYIQALAPEIERLEQHRVIDQLYHLIEAQGG